MKSSGRRQDDAEQGWNALRTTRLNGKDVSRMDEMATEDWDVVC